MILALPPVIDRISCEGWRKVLRSSFDVLHESTPYLCSKKNRGFAVLHIPYSSVPVNAAGYIL